MRSHLGAASGGCAGLCFVGDQLVGINLFCTLLFSWPCLRSCGIRLESPIFGCLCFNLLLNVVMFFGIACNLIGVVLKRILLYRFSQLFLGVYNIFLN